MTASVQFYTEKLAFTVEFNYEGFYVGVRTGDHLIHLKLIDEPDPSIPFVDDGGHLHLYLQTDNVKALAAKFEANGIQFVQGIEETAWNTREFVIHDDQGHTLYFGESLK